MVKQKSISRIDIAYTMELMTVTIREMYMNYCAYSTAEKFAAASKFTSLYSYLIYLLRGDSVIISIH